MLDSMLYETLKWLQIAPFCISSKVIMACTLLSFSYVPVFYSMEPNTLSCGIICCTNLKVVKISKLSRRCYYSALPWLPPPILTTLEFFVAYYLKYIPPYIYMFPLHNIAVPDPFSPASRTPTATFLPPYSRVPGPPVHRLI